MTVGVVILQALGNNPPSAGAFCLSSYNRAVPVEEAVLSRALQPAGRWGRIEIYYSGTISGNIEKLASRSRLASPDDVNFHFCLCNGSGGDDGQIQATEKWKRQWPLIPGPTWYGTSQTIRICIIADGITSAMTDSQIKRMETLLDELCRKFRIQPESISYPGDWR